jgi:hypothetical protein
VPVRVMIGRQTRGVAARACAGRSHPLWRGRYVLALTRGPPGSHPESSEGRSDPALGLGRKS